MIRVGNILINPDDISSVHQEPNKNIQIIFKNGVVKNFNFEIIGLTYNVFIDSLMKQKEKDESDHIFRIMTAIKSLNNG